MPTDPVAALTLLAGTADPTLVQYAASYRPRFANPSWPTAAPFVVLGILAAAPTSRGQRTATAQWCTRHVTARLERGASRTVPGVWSVDAVEATLTASSTSVASGAAMATALRRVSRVLVPRPTPPAAVKHARRDQLPPYSSDELADLVEAATRVASALWRVRACLLVVLHAGAGARPKDLEGLSAAAFRISADGVALTLANGRVAWVRTELEDLAAATVVAAGELDGNQLLPVRNPSSAVFERTPWPHGLTRPSVARLRATWTVWTLAGGASVPAFLRAADITSFDTWYAPVRFLPALDPEAYRAQVRGTTDPFTPSGRPLDGQPWPAPPIPLRDDAVDGGATLPEQAHTGSYAIDGSSVRTWARQNRAQPRAPWLHPDPDAAWNGKASWGRHGHTSGWFGYWLHGLVRVGEVGAPDSPHLVERIDLTPANADARVAGVDLLTRMAADHETADALAGKPDRPRKDVLADRAYTSESKRADDWVWPLWALGFTSVHELTEHQLGPARRVTSTGALVIDGQPHSPRLPTHLRRLTPPGVGATRADIAAYQQQVAQRRPYTLHAIGGRNEDGSWDFGCRAMALLGQLRCDLKPRSLAGSHANSTTDPTVFTPANPARLPKVCGQEKARVAREELPFWQAHLYGSADWYASYNRRNVVEGVFGNLKNDATQDLTRGNVRVMGLAKTAVLTLMAVIATNLRLLDRWTERQAVVDRDCRATPPRTRKPRRRTQLLVQTRERIARAQHDAAAIAAHEPLGTPILT